MFNLRKPKKKYMHGLVLTAEATAKLNASRRHEVIVECVRSFPDTISSQEAYYRLDGALAAIHLTVDWKSKAGESASRLARKKAGFKPKHLGRGKGCVWVRVGRALPGQSSVPSA